MGSVSLALLNKKKSAPEAPKVEETKVEETVVEEAQEATSEPEVADAARDDENVVVDVDKMTAKQLDELVNEHKIEVPETWYKMKVGEKRAHLKSLFPEDGAEVEDAETPEAETTAAAPAVEEATVVSETPAKAPKAGKGKAVGALAKTGEVLAKDDAIVDVVSTIENLKEADAKSLVNQLKDEPNFTFFKLGGVLSVIQAQGWFKPHASFKEYVENEHGIKYRTAMYFIQMYNDLAESGIPWSKLAPLGWTKIAKISGILTKENVDKWVELASSQTAIQLEETVKNHKKGEQGKLSSPDEEVKTVTTMTFKVHDDQKKIIREALDKAKEASGTDVDTVALEFVMMQYVSSGAAVIDLKKLFEKRGYEQVFEAVGEAFPQFNIEVTEIES